MTKLPYDPSIAMHRRHLAQRVLLVLSTAGFMEEAVTERNARVQERVFYRSVDMAPGVRVQVWTSIVGDGDSAEVRAVGEDAIRVCAVYRNKKSVDRGIIATTRIHRVGAVEDICERLLTRMRDAYGKARRPQCCSKCGAPTFRSKKGNDVCSDFCFSTNRVQDQQATS